MEGLHGDFPVAIHNLNGTFADFLTSHGLKTGFVRLNGGSLVYRCYIVIEETGLNSGNDCRESSGDIIECVLKNIPQEEAVDKLLELIQGE